MIVGRWSEREAEGMRRRLITLIFADRAAEEPAVMVVIRRELPRTSIAGLSHRPVA
jgi:septum formation topological specificity factor MinE